MSLDRAGSVTVCKVAVFVISCERYKDRWPRIQAMFAALHWSDYWIVTGRPDLSTTHEVDGQHLYLQCDDTYEALPVKLTRLCQAFASDTLWESCEYLWKVDDDVGIMSSFALSNLQSGLQGADYAGASVQCEKGNRRWHLSKCSATGTSKWKCKAYDGLYVPWAKGGFSYCLSKKAASVVGSVTSEPEWVDKVLNDDIYEDLAVAKVLLRHNIHPVELSYMMQDMQFDVYGTT
jgi:hypothetical protein